MKLVENKKLTLVYSIQNTFEAGIELEGHEVKSLRSKLGSLEGSKVLIRGGEAFLVGVYIPPYQAANTEKSYDPYRTRKILLNKEEIEEMYNFEMTKTLTLHPISLYTKGNLIKCEVAVCKKKDTRDKRQDIKKDIDRRELRNL
ncbi:MAG: SsrA-binding protein SsrA-binding protein [Candidatus Nomurabacteria bacterium]|nr:SsrA-binding protein SsrA-binding protein [Candidatus Nomurabacteria bacterium]